MVGRARRGISAAILAAFLIATGLQLLLHAHLVEGHHAHGCDADAVEIAHAHPLAGHPGSAFAPAPDPDSPATPQHDHCARCVNPIADLRVRPAALAALGSSRPEHCPRPIARAAAPRRLGHELRGPPLA